MSYDDHDELQLIRHWHFELCSACGFFVYMPEHTEERCKSAQGNLIGEMQRTEVPQAFYQAFEGETPFQC